MTSSERHALQQIADWSSALTFDNIPPVVREIVRRCLIDTVGVSIPGAMTDVAKRARQVAETVGATGKATVFGGNKQLAEPSAAFANAAAGHALDFDDNSYAGVVHGSVVVIPAAIAVAESIDASGADLLTAITAGSEAEYALGIAATPSLYARGWWTTGVLGPVGAAAATARLLKLDSNATASALGLALAGTGGAKAVFGTNGKSLLAGRSAEAGVIAAMLAARGATGPHDAAENTRGFARLFNDSIWDQSATAALGTRWHLIDPGIDVKRIPVCLSSHAAVDAVQDVVTTHNLTVSDIHRIVCDVPPVVATNLVYVSPRTPQEAQFSMQFAIAASLYFGDIRLEHLTQSVVSDPDLVATMNKVVMEVGPRWNDAAARDAAPEGAGVLIETHDGRLLEGFRAYPRGAAHSPLSDDEIDTKFRDCAVPHLGTEATEALLKNLRDFDRLASARDLLAALRG